MSKDQRKMMDDKRKLVHESANPVTLLFRLILEEIDLGAGEWNRKLTMFLNSHLSRVPKNAKDIGQERNNFNRAISRRAMTWKTFQKAIQIMGPLRYRITIDMEWRKGPITTVTTGMIPNPLAEIYKLNNQRSPEELDPTFADVTFEEDEDAEEENDHGE